MFLNGDAMSFLYRISTQRTAWFLLFISIVGFELTALYFEHVMKLAPCVMCIYERVAMMGVGIAALVGMMAPGNVVFRWLGFAGWGYSAFRGLQLAMEHVSYQFPDPNVLFGATCDLFVRFPEWAPLNKWAPWMFEAYGDCGKVVWQFLTLSMPQWLVVIFAAQLAVLAVVVVSQLFGKRERTLFK